MKNFSEERDEEPDEVVNEEEFMRHIERWKQAEREHDLEESLGAMSEIFALAAEHADKNPDEFLSRREEADACLERADWDAAETIWHEMLRQAEEETHGDNPFKGFMEQWRLWTDLSHLHTLLERDDEAFSDVKNATAAARGADTDVLLGEALGAQARFALQRGEVETARLLIEEARGLAQKFEAEIDFPFASATNRVQVLDASCLLHEGREDEAKICLQQVHDALDSQLDNPIMAGNQRLKAMWWETWAALCARRGDMDGEVEALREASEKRRLIASLPHVAGVFSTFYFARSLERYGHAAQRSGDNIGGASALAESRALLRQIGL